VSWSRDENAEYDRPQRRTRPRTKNRPSHDDAQIGVVITIDRGRVTCLVDPQTPDERLVTATKARQLGRRRQLDQSLGPHQPNEPQCRRRLKTDPGASDNPPAEKGSRFGRR